MLYQMVGVFSLNPIWVGKMASMCDSIHDDPHHTA